MTIRYHVTVDRQGGEWWAVCPALRHHGAAIGGETREEALAHIENAILMILKEMASNGIPPPPRPIAAPRRRADRRDRGGRNDRLNCQGGPHAHSGNRG